MNLPYSRVTYSLYNSLYAKQVQAQFFQFMDGEFGIYEIINTKYVLFISVNYPCMNRLPRYSSVFFAYIMQPIANLKCRQV